ncbi:MAG: hypothetical protein ACJAT4_001342 [Granulosicoccus sp.]|jgi:hypothetical protein
MTNLIQFEKTFSRNLLTDKEKSSLKGRGMGNMMDKAGKKCPPAVDEGKLEIKSKFY